MAAVLVLSVSVEECVNEAQFIDLLIDVQLGILIKMLETERQRWGGAHPSCPSLPNRSALSFFNLVHDMCCRTSWALPVVYAFGF